MMKSEDWPKLYDFVIKEENVGMFSVFGLYEDFVMYWTQLRSRYDMVEAYRELTKDNSIIFLPLSFLFLKFNLVIKIC